MKIRELSTPVLSSEGSASADGAPLLVLPAAVPQKTGRLALAWQGLRLWTGRQLVASLVGALAVGLLIGFATVLIPNPVFGREIPPVWWNYPVWIATSLLSGMLIATYVRPRYDAAGTSGAEAQVTEPARTDAARTAAAGADAAGTAAPRTEIAEAEAAEAEEAKGSKLGIAGGVLAWFAVGCPVCNKLALIALGYSGAITWFAPIQPYMAIVALVLTGVALVIRLAGQIACPVSPLPSPTKTA